MASRRKRKPKAAKRRLTRRLLAAVVTLFVLVVVGGFLVLLALRAYLHSDKFRTVVGDEVSQVFKADGEFTSFQWTGMAAYTDGYNAKGRSGAFFSRARADGVRARVNFGAVWDRVWEITDVDVDRLDVLIDPVRGDKPRKNKGQDPGEGGDSGSEAGWLSSFLPKQVVVKRAGVAEMNFDWRLDQMSVSGRGTRLEIKPTVIPGVHRVVAQQGRISSPDMPALELQGAEIRAGNGSILIDRASLSLFDNARLSLNGEVKLDSGNSPELDLNARFRNVPASEILPEDWTKRLKGVVEVDVDITGEMSAANPQALRWSGQARLLDGIFEAMPILERLDEMLGSSRFRRLSFNDFKVDFVHEGSKTTLEDVFLLSSGTACLKGRVVLSNQGDPSGIYMLGINPDVIKWLPLIKKTVIEEVFCHDRDKAFETVFAQAGGSAEKPPEGFRWAICRIDPSAADPFTADIRNQFFNKGGLALWAELAGAGEKGLRAIGLLADRARDQGIDLMTVLTKGSEQAEGGLIGRENLMRAAEELGVETAVRRVLKGLVEGVGELPGTLLRTGGEILDGLIP
jgi:hypothetical protein